MQVCIGKATHQEFIFSHLQFQPHQMESITSSGTPSVVTSRSAAFHWTEDMEQVLIREMAEQCLAGHRTEVGIFHPLAWIEMAENLNSLSDFQATQVVVKKIHMYNRLRVIKKTYSAMKKILIASGFGWDHEAKRVVGKPNVWQTFEEGNSWAIGYRNKKLPD